ncbi:hypothetical protein Bbelb_299370 [Branchiostoma belcheri]|nr:hypothetical protein Bbelb_299370 [Branchiostoma belcheri]
MQTLLKGLERRGNQDVSMKDAGMVLGSSFQNNRLQYCLPQIEGTAAVYHRASQETEGRANSISEVSPGCPGARLDGWTPCPSSDFYTEEMTTIHHVVHSPDRTALLPSPNNAQSLGRTALPPPPNNAPSPDRDDRWSTNRLGGGRTALWDVPNIPHYSQSTLQWRLKSLKGKS